VNASFRERCILLQTGIVDQDVNGSQFSKHFLERPLDLVFPGNIGCMGIGFAAGLSPEHPIIQEAAAEVRKWIDGAYDAFTT